ncbi:MAG: hypothetical protein QM691_10880 [Opitutaceae bacterium]
MHKILTTACGVLNTAFVGFHLLLATWIQRMPLAPDARALMHAFNVGGLLMIGFLAYAFLFCREDLLTRLGRGAILLGALVYLTRAAGELAFFPAPKPAIVAACVLAGLLHLPLLRATKAAA